jgi:hypothetical protein
MNSRLNYTSSSKTTNSFTINSYRMTYRELANLSLLPTITLPGDDNYLILLIIRPNYNFTWPEHAY